MYICSFSQDTVYISSVAVKGDSRMDPLALEFVRKRSTPKGGIKGKSLKGNDKVPMRKAVHSEELPSNCTLSFTLNQYISNRIQTMPDQSRKSTCLSCWETAKKDVDAEFMRADKEHSRYINSLASAKKEAVDKAYGKAMIDWSTLTGQRYGGSWDFHPDCPDCGVSQFVQGVRTVLMV